MTVLFGYIAQGLGPPAYLLLGFRRASDSLLDNLLDKKTCPAISLLTAGPFFRLSDD